MYNVMKAQKYQLLRSNSTYIILAIIFLGVGLCIFTELSDASSAELNASSVMIMMSEMLMIFLPMLTMLYTPNICAGDLKDKTLNYELLTGTKRRDCFFGRFFVAVIVNLLVNFALILIPALAFTAMYGWGHATTVQDYALRTVSIILPLIRMTALYTFFSFLIRNNTAVYAIGYVLSMIDMLASALLSEFFDSNILMYFLSFDTFNRVLVPKNYGYGYFDGEDIMVVKDMLEVSTAVHAAAAGLAGTAVFLILGYLVFRKSDMN